MNRSRPMRTTTTLTSLALAALLPACAVLPGNGFLSPAPASSQFTLLAGSDDPASSGLEVRTAQGVKQLRQPYDRVTVNKGGALSQDSTSAAEVRASHTVLMSMPVPRLDPPAPPPPPPAPPAPPPPPSSSVILLPQADGSPSAVEVRTPVGVQQVNRPYEVAQVSDSGALTLGKTSAEEVNRRFPDLIGLQLPPPERFTLQFEAGTSRLTASSLALLETVLARANARPGGEIVVTGHTDRQGAEAVNDSLSLQRAQTVRGLLIARGFNPQLVQAIGRGEREPVVPTDDGVAESRNRRVDLLLR